MFVWQIISESGRRSTTGNRVYAHKGVPRVRFPLSPPEKFVNFYFYRIIFFNLPLTFFNLPALEPHTGFEAYRVLKSIHICDTENTALIVSSNFPIVTTMEQKS
jgi:hypothetical protein